MTAESKPEAPTFPKGLAPAELDPFPVTYQEVHDYNTALLEQTGQINPFHLRVETFRRIETVTGRKLIAYVTRTSNLQPGADPSIEDRDLTGFGDLALTSEGDAIDVFLVSNGGSPTATERIVNLLRPRYESVRFIIPANAFSAATMMCFSGNSVLMTDQATLGPIDPQIDRVPARTILRAFENLEERVEREGPASIAAFAPLISKYSLHLLEICKSAQELSEELATTWLHDFMLPEGEDETIEAIVNFFGDFDTQKSHGRSIGRAKAKDLGLMVEETETIEGLDQLVRSLYNQYEYFFDRTPFYKLFENVRGISWGRQQVPQVQVQPSP